MCIVNGILSTSLFISLVIIYFSVASPSPSPPLPSPPSRDRRGKLRTQTPPTGRHHNGQHSWGIGWHLQAKQGNACQWCHLEITIKNRCFPQRAEWWLVQRKRLHHHLPGPRQCEQYVWSDTSTRTRLSHEKDVGVVKRERERKIEYIMSMYIYISIYLVAGSGANVHSAFKSTQL